MGHVWRLVTGGTKKRLLLGVLASFAVPAGTGWVAKTFVQPGIHQDPERTARIIDYMTLGAIGFGLTMVFTTMMGVLIIASMKGPACTGDGFEAGDPANIDPNEMARKNPW